MGGWGGQEREFSLRERVEESAGRLAGERLRLGVTIEVEAEQV